MNDLKKVRGLKDMVSDAVEHGTSKIEEVHLATARKPFGVLESIPVIAEPTKGVHAVHDTIVATSYGAVRAVARAVSQAADLALDALEGEKKPEAGSQGGTSD